MALRDEFQRIAGIKEKESEKQSNKEYMASS